MIRREFLRNAGCLTIGFTLGKSFFAEAGQKGYLADELPQSLQRNAAINAWLQITSGGRLHVFTGKMELGQGIRTAIAQVAAEELDMRMDQVDVTLAETGVTPDEGYTAGSGSIDNSAMSVRYAAAAARQKLLALAAIALKTPEPKLTMSEGTIMSHDKTKKISFVKLLAGKQITDKVTLPVKLKPNSGYKLSGKAIARDDIRSMVTGKPVFVQDLRFPGMLHARILRPPSYGARLISFDEVAAKIQFPNLIKAVVDGSFIGVITEHEYTAVQIQTVGSNFCEWDKKTTLIPGDVKSLKAYLKTLPSKKEQVKAKGNLSIEPGAGTHQASYYKPYMMHGSIGPSCSVAIYEKEKLHIWSHSQGIYPLRVALQKMLNLSLDNIHIIGVPGAGCYGHNGADDVSAEVALLALANPGKYIRLQWSREDEHAWEPYGSAMIMELEAKLDQSGRITDWRYDLWSDTHATRPGGNPENLLTAKYIAKSFPGKPGGFSGGAYRNAEPYYVIANQQIDVHFFDGPLRVSALRSLGAYGNIFAIECFMDELADKAGKDPFEFRLMHLVDDRAKAVLLKLKNMADARKESPVNARFVNDRRSVDNSIEKNMRYGTGIAFSRYKNSAAYCAVAAEVSYNKDTEDLIIHYMYSVIDAGETINMDGIINQTEGGMIQAASWTMQEEVKFDSDRILSVDWKTYPIFRFNQVPETDVVVLNNPAEGPMGAGEAAQGPAGAAIANAIYRATGIRHRDLPIKPLPLPKD
ncbi:MAG: xanthine dehydrogenase family protein molybdopterin-binding subunit [Chitinophagaceae bacterium]|nr:MAG: xanthine dehydrogenase family protein molybdopterin-binding subunit [Chitinophagaceae bacterium]